MSDIYDSPIIKALFDGGMISNIPETELERYTNFFDSSYKDNYNHCKHVLETYPRWSIISGYYAMHDISKLFLVNKYRIRIDMDVHKTTIEVLSEGLKDYEIIELFKIGYEEYLKMSEELSYAKRERTRAQYYTGTAFMSSDFKRRSKRFHEETVEPYMDKMLILMDGLC